MTKNREDILVDTPSDQLNEYPIVDSLGDGVISNYDRLINEFGIKRIDEVINKYQDISSHFLINRDVMFGHQDLDLVFGAIRHNKPFAIMTGIKPSGSYHVGSLSTVNEVKYFQDLGGKLSFCIADIETYATTDLSFSKMREIAVDNIADLLAMGVSDDPDDTFIYFQSEDPVVQHYGHLFASHVTVNMMRGIYGDKKSLGYYDAALILVADILRPQIVWEAMPTITPVGADQAPHSRLTRDIAQKEEFQKRFNLYKPSFTYHRMLKGIDGSEKMSKSNEMSYFSIDDDFKSIESKINNGLTGGKDTAKEQRSLGGDPDSCRIFDLFTFMFETDDKRLNQRSIDCRNGDLLCGPCKGDLKHKISEFRNEFIEKKTQMIEISTQLVEDISRK